MTEDSTLDEIRTALAPDLAANAAFDGWGDAALAMAAENAPAFGLAGTLLALSQLPADPGQGMNAALAGAVLTTLYGVLLAQLVLTPLAEAIRRSGEAEEQARDELMRWTAWQLEGAVVHPLPLPDAAEAA